MGAALVLENAKAGEIPLEEKIIMKLKKSLLVSAMAAIIAFGGAEIEAQEPTFFKIASGSAGGTYFPMAGLLANAISNPPGSRPCEKRGSCGVPGLIAIAMSANGSVANVNSVQTGLVESGFSTAEVSYWSYTGTGVFKGQEPKKKLRQITALYRETMHVIVRADSKFKSVNDLRGGRIGVGLQASGARVVANLVLEAAGMKENEHYTPEYINSAQAIERIRDGHLDANLTSTGYPQAATSELASTVGARLLPVEGDLAEKIKKAAPFFDNDIIPGGVYDGIKEDIPVMSSPTLWIVNADVPDDLVYGVTKALWNKNTRKLLDNGHRKGRDIILKRALSAPVVPLHPGAERFYREVGMEIPKVQSEL